MLARAISRKTRGTAATVLLVIHLLGVGTLAHAEGATVLRFAALGDLPYKEGEREAMPRWLNEIAQTKPAFMLHVGDFKRARERCDDALFKDRFDLFNASALPFIFTPGDNEWSDCDLLAGGAYDPVERLNVLRRLFFAHPESLGQRRIAVEQQPGFPENLRWSQEGVQFVTLNLPAGNNYGIRHQPNAEFVKRDAANQTWTQQAFQMARQNNVRALVIAFQANPGFRLHRVGLPSPGFKTTLLQLQTMASQFDRPVLLLHGDTHSYRFDQPLNAIGTLLPLTNVWRLEVPGSPAQGWVEVRVQDDPKRPFAVRKIPLN